MTVTEQKKALTQKFERLSEHVAHGNPNDFSLQLPLTLESLDPEDQSMTCSFSIQERFGNPQGIAHGGIIATIMDIAQGAAVGTYAEENRRMTTASLQISYLNPVHIGEKLYVRTKITEIGRTMVFCTAEAWQNRDSPTTLATSIYHMDRHMA